MEIMALILGIIIGLVIAMVYIGVTSVRENDTTPLQPHELNELELLRLVYINSVEWVALFYGNDKLFYFVEIPVDQRRVFLALQDTGIGDEFFMRIDKDSGEAQMLYYESNIYSYIKEKDSNGKIFLEERILF